MNQIRSMGIIEWIDKHINDISQSLLFSKYFDSINIEEGVDSYYFLNPYLGIDIILRVNKTVKAIHFYSDGHPGVEKFIDNLPKGLDFSYSRKQIHDLFGEPIATGGGGRSLLYENVPTWDKYQFDSHSLHLQYNANESSINLLTIESLISNETPML